MLLDHPHGLRNDFPGPLTNRLLQGLGNDLQAGFFSILVSKEKVFNEKFYDRSQSGALVKVRHTFYQTKDAAHKYSDCLWEFYLPYRSEEDWPRILF